MIPLYEAESLWLEPIGKRGNAYYLSINGHEYGYDMTAQNWGKFLKILQFSRGRALAWLKKNSKLVAGSKKKQNESKTAERLKNCNMPMKQFVDFRDKMSTPDETPEYSAFRINKSGAFIAPCVPAADLKFVNDDRFWLNTVLKSNKGPVPAGDYELIFQQFMDSKDDFLLGIGQYDSKTNRMACYVIWSREFEKSNNVIIKQYVLIPW